MCRRRLKSLASLLTAFSLLVAQSQTVFADIFNSATATANYQGSVVNSAPATASIPVAPAAPSFTIVKTVDKPSLSAPETLTYTIQVSNTGNVSLTSPNLTDTLAQGASGLSLTSGPTLVSGDDNVPGALEVGETWTYTADYAASQTDLNNAADIVNTATFDTAETEPASASATTTVSQSPALTLVKTATLNDGGDGVTVGDTINYSFTITNTGNVTLTDIAIADTLPDVVMSGGPIASLAPKATDSTSITALYTLTQADLDAGQVVNTATASGTPPSGSPVSNTSSVTLPFAGTPQISLAKSGTLNDGGDGIANAGDTVAYAFTITNTGNVALSNVSVSDALPGVVISGGPLASLAPGAVDSASITGLYTLTEADTAQGQVANTATVTATPPFGSTITSTASTTTSLPVAASVTGTVFLDRNGNGVFDGDPAAGTGYVVELFDASGNIVGTAVTGADGKYTINAAPGANYKLIFKKSNGRIIGEIGNVTLTGGQTLFDQNLPVDPAGVVYNSVTRQPAAGVTVTITDAAGNPLPAVCLLDPGQQGQVTGANGAYNFDVIPGAGPACPAGETEYRLGIVTPAGYLPGVSASMPAQTGALDASACPGDAAPNGPCQVAPSNAPPGAVSGIYFLRFFMGA
jgi:uncharacterized repeat protein (TIGR01451 family)